MRKKRVQENIGKCFATVQSCVAKHPTTILVVIAVLTIAFATYLAALYGIAIFFAFLSIAVAVFFASRSLRFASESSELARESLELTRAMQRPFLAWKASPLVNITPDMIKLEFKIENTGSMPASDVHAYVQFFDEDERVTDDNLSSKYPPLIEQSVVEGYDCFFLLPSHTLIKDCVLDLRQKNHLDLWENIKNEKVKVRLRIMYKGVGRKHVTIQTGHLLKQIGTELLTTPIVPQEWD